MEKLLTIKQICEILQVSRSTVYEWVHIGFIPHYKYPGGLRFRESEVDRWLRRRRECGRTTYKTSI